MTVFFSAAAAAAVAILPLHPSNNKIDNHPKRKTKVTARPEMMFIKIFWVLVKREKEIALQHSKSSN